MRIGQWEYSLPFSIGNFYSRPMTSVRFSLTTSNVTPVLAQFAVSGVNPTGCRHLTTHPSFIRILGSGSGPASPAFGDLDLQSLDISSGSGVSKTKCFIFRISDFECPAASRVYGMKLWVSKQTDFLTHDWKVAHEIHNTWQQNKVIPVTYLADKTKWLSDTLPENQNLFRQDGKYTIHGVNDNDVSQYIYVALVASGTLPLGEYGGSTSGFYLRVSYNFDNIEPLRD